VKKLHGIHLEWAKDDSGRPTMKEVPGSEFTLDCDLCLLAMGFLGPSQTARSRSSNSSSTREATSPSMKTT